MHFTSRRQLDIFEIARRVGGLLLVTMALVAPAIWGRTAAVAIAALAVAVYWAIPRLPRPEGALGYERVPAVLVPDLVGFLMTGIFLALPFWARAGDGDLWKNFGLLVHPAALLTWPLAAISVVILVFSARYASFWMTIEPSGIRIHTLTSTWALPHGEIRAVEPYRRGLPSWLRLAAPLLVATGRYTEAGAILLARDSSGMTLSLRDGTAVSFDIDGLERPARKLLSALAAEGVHLDPSLKSR